MELTRRYNDRRENYVRWPSKGFFEFVSRYRGKLSPLGDLADDFWRDDISNKILPTSKEAVEQYLVGAGRGTPERLEMLDRAWQNWRKSK